MAANWPKIPAFNSPADVDYQLPAGWKVEQIENLFEQLPVGKRFDKKTSRACGATPVIDQSKDGVVGWHDEQPGVPASSERPVVTFANHTCEMRWMLRPFSVIQNVFPLIGRVGVVDTRFLYYGTKGRVHLEEYKGHFPDYRRKWIALPPITEQRSIVEVLGALDDRIDNLRQTNATLEAIAAALFKSWFVDFDGVAAEDMQESELGLIPKGWRAGVLANLCNLNGSKWNDKKHPPTVRYIDLSGVSSNRIESVTEFVFNEAPSRARLHLREGDTIVGTVRPGNRAFAYIHEPEENLTGSTGFAVLSPKQTHFSSFIYLGATRDEAIKRLANLADGAAYPAVRPDVVANTPCVIPSNEVLVKFANVTQPLLDRIVKSNKQAATLAVLRDTLLPRLISGKLRVQQ